MTSHVESRESSAYAMGDLFDALYRCRKVVLACTLATACLAGLYAWLARPVYRSEAVLLPVTRNGGADSLAGLAGQFGGLASLAGVNLPKSDDRDETLAILKSQAFISQFVSDLNLLPKLYARRWDEKSRRWVRKQPTLGDGVYRFTHRVMAVAEDTGSNLVRLRIDWYDAKEGATWANELVDRLNETMRHRALERAKQSIGFLTNELANQPVLEVRQAIYRQMDTQLQNAMAANVTRDFSLRVLDPAMVADPDKFVWPKRVLVVAIGIVLGFAIGCLVALVLTSRSAGLAFAASNRDERRQH